MASQCNLITNNTDPRWRNQLYCDDLDWVLALFTNPFQPPQNVSLSPGDEAFTSSPLHSSQRSHRPSGLDIVTSHALTATSVTQALPPVCFGASAQYNHPNSSTSGTWLTSFQDLRTIDTSTCSVTSSDFLSDGSLSPTRSSSEPSSQTSSSFTRCPSCTKAFGGEPRNQRRNLRRHMFSSHSVDPRLPCLVSTCSKTFAAGRVDNRKRHMEQQHKWRC